MPKISIVLLIILHTIATSSGKYIPQKKYGEGFWPIDVGIKENINGEKIMNYYDFNHDKATDIVTLTKFDSRQYLSIYVWVNQRNNFTRVAQSSSGYPQVLSILSTDFQMDGDPDIIIFSRNRDEDEYSYQIYFLSVKCIKYQCKIQQTQWKYPLEDSQKIDPSFPFLMTLSDKPALIVSESMVLKALLWKNGNLSKSVFGSSTYFQHDQEKINSLQIGKWVQYHYYGDFDGDCQTDLILMVKSENKQKSVFQFFRGVSSSKFKHLQSIKFMHYVNHFFMSDANFDGRLDLITLFNDEQGRAKSSIHYHKHGFGELCTSYLTTDQILTNQPIPYDFTPEANAEEVKQFNSFHLSFSFKVHPQYSVLRLGDFDSDGYTDMAVTLESIQDGSLKSFLFHNQQCQVKTCGNKNQNFISKAKTLNIRYFRKLMNQQFARSLHSQLQKNKSQFIQSISFFDIYEDGFLDFFVNILQINPLTNQKKYSIVAVFNNIRIDAFFMKFLIYDGKSKMINQNGVLNGGNIQFYATLLSGKSTPLSENQLPQYSGRTLELPYILVGIGRTNNYAEQITVTYPYQDKNTKSWTPVIPNSQIFIIPPRQGINQKWLMSTFISPSSALANVFFLVVVSLIVIGCVIVYQNRKQKQVDKEEQDVYFSTLK